MLNNLSSDLAPRLIRLLAGGHGESEFLSRVLREVRDVLKCRYAAVKQGVKGRWRTIAESGDAAAIPNDLLSEALDREHLVKDEDWIVVPISPQTGSGELLVVNVSFSTDDILNELEEFAATLATGLATVRSRRRQQQRIDRLEAILEIAGQWNQTQEMDHLLQQMAETSTRLLRAERASIFLWDRPNKTLVGRPALGVEGGELRIPDDTGIVGQVIHSGQPRRVDADIEEEQQEIDRRVDKQLDFKTASLLCVPLRSRSGEMFGAFEMINKIKGNFTDEDEAALTELAAHAAIALKNTKQHESLLRSRNQMVDQAAEGVQLIGNCPAIEALQSTIRRVANTELAVLIMGENGTGKEVVARMIHYLSNRRHEPLVAVNCAALTETLLESELFGHEKGAFTDAHETRVGKFELASGGTLFLDEIGDMSVSGQAKLLRVLEEKVVVRVGGSTPIHTDARVFAATNQNLAEMVRNKKFREDLYYRLNVVTLELPSLRERGEDVLLLAEHFLKDFCAQARRRPPTFTAAARKRLLSHTWPGNVRELRNLMERLAYLLPEDTVDAEDVAFILSPDEGSPYVRSLDLTLTDATREFQAEYIKKHIEMTRGNMTDAARRLGLHRSNLYRKMRQLNMTTGDKEENDEAADRDQ